MDAVARLSTTWSLRCAQRVVPVRLHKDKSGSGPFRCKALAAEGNWPRSRRLQIIAHMARWRRRVWPKAARLFQMISKLLPRLAFPEALREPHKFGRGFTNRKFALSGRKTKAFVAVLKK